MEFDFLVTNLLSLLILGGEDQSSLISLVKTFDSMLSAYEGFCNLRQVFMLSSHGSIFNYSVVSSCAYFSVTVNFCSFVNFFFFQFVCISVAFYPLCA